MASLCRGGEGARRVVQARRSDLLCAMEVSEPHHPDELHQMVVAATAGPRIRADRRVGGTTRAVEDTADVLVVVSDGLSGDGVYHLLRDAELTRRRFVIAESGVGRNHL